MTLLHGAIHDPDHPALALAQPFIVRAHRPHDWFADWGASGWMLGNDKLSNCCEVADLLLVDWRRQQVGLPALTESELIELIELRYRQIAAWDGGRPGNDPGSITQWDCASWQDAGIVVGGHVWNADWHSAEPGDVSEALSEAPALVTLALDAATEDAPGQWWRPLTGDTTVYHRVIAGAVSGGLVRCRTYGRDVVVSRSRIVAVDLMRFA